MNDVIGLVTFANPNPWVMIDENTGKKTEGNSIEYLVIDSLKPVENEDGSKGYKFCKESLPTDKACNIKTVPAYYKLTFGFKNVKGKLQLKLEDIEYLSEV